MVQRLTYRKRHSYATRSNQHRVVKTPGKSWNFSPSRCFDALALRCSRGCLYWSECALKGWNCSVLWVFFLSILWKISVIGTVLKCLWWMSKCRWEACVPEHQEESQWPQVPSDRQEDSGGKNCCCQLRILIFYMVLTRIRCCRECSVLIWC